MILKEEKLHGEICRNCHKGRMKSWDKLSMEEKMTAERIPRGEEISKSRLKNFQFCTNCWFMEFGERETFA